MIHISLGINVCVPQTRLVLKQQKNSKPTDFHSFLALNVLSCSALGMNRRASARANGGGTII